MTSSDTPVPSPCIAVCVLDPVHGWCEGCLRTLEEIAGWSGFDDARRREVVASAALRGVRDGAC